MASETDKTIKDEEIYFQMERYKVSDFDNKNAAVAELIIRLAKKERNRIALFCYRKIGDLIVKFLCEKLKDSILHSSPDCLELCNETNIFILSGTTYQVDSIECDTILYHGYTEIGDQFLPMLDFVGGGSPDTRLYVSLQCIGKLEPDFNKFGDTQRQEMCGTLFRYFGEDAKENKLVNFSFI